MKIVVIETNQENILKITYGLESSFGKHLIDLTIVNNYVEGLNAIQSHDNPVVFLNVNIGGLKKGYQFLKLIDATRNVVPIFISHLSLPASEVFTLQAIDFLPSPFTVQEVQRALQNALARRMFRSLPDVAQMILDAHSRSITRRNVIIKSRDKWDIVPQDDIIYLEASGSYCTVHTIGREAIKSSKNLKYYEELIGGNPSFLKIHKSFLINKEQTDSFDTSAREFLMKNNHRVPTTLTLTRLEQLFLQLM
ncbi:MAG: LytTR family transcriptional regulator DNA-binding domain-containing protein [Chitinophagaceae bacterium]